MFLSAGLVLLLPSQVYSVIVLLVPAAFFQPLPCGPISLPEQLTPPTKKPSAYQYLKARPHPTHSVQPLGVGWGDWSSQSEAQSLGVLSEYSLKTK